MTSFIRFAIGIVAVYAITTLLVVSSLRAQDGAGFSSYEADTKEHELRELVWNQVLQETLIRQAAERMNITINDAQLQTIMLNEPPDYLMKWFSDSNGILNRELYGQFITDVDGFVARVNLPPDEARRYKRVLASVRESVRTTRLRRAVEEKLNSSMTMSPEEAFSEYAHRNGRATGSYAMLSLGSIADQDVPISETEARNYFNAHRSEFSKPAARELQYVLFPLTPSHEDSNAVVQQLASVKKELASAVAPETKTAMFATWIESEKRQSMFWNTSLVDAIDDTLHLEMPGYVNGKAINAVEYQLWLADAAKALGSWGYESESSEVNVTTLSVIPEGIRDLLAEDPTETIAGPIWLDDGAHLAEIIETTGIGEASVKVQHILLTIPTPRRDDSVKAFAQQLVRRAKSGESFEQMAYQYSADQGTASRGGNLEYFKRGAMVKPFEEACFNAEPGDIVGPVKTNFGYHVIKVNDRKSGGIRMRDWKLAPRISDRTKAVLRQRAETFRSQVAGGADMVSLAKRDNVQLIEQGGVQRNEYFAGSIKLSRFAYKGHTGDISPITEVSNGDLAIAQITKVRNDDSVNYDDVRDAVMEAARRQKKLDMLMERATKLRMALKGKNIASLKSLDPSLSIESFTDVLGYPADDRLALDHVLDSAVFAQKLGEVSSAIRGTEGCYIVLVTRRDQPSKKDFEEIREDFIGEVLAERREAAFNEWLYKQHEDADIEDLRKSVYW